MSLCLLVPVVTHSQGKGNKRPSPKTQEPSSEQPSAKPLTPRQIVDRVLPSVVLIVAQDENGEPLGQGSGFFYESGEPNPGEPSPTRETSLTSPYDAIVAAAVRKGSGLVATNLHVFTRASQAYVKVLGSGITYKVTEVVGIDMRRDLCVIRVDDNSTLPLSLSRSSKPSVGDEVFVVGNPKGLEGSVSKGIVSSLRKEAGLIQIDAAISPGSSGGPVVNDRAEVVGIAVSSLVGGQNLNFAVPIEYLSSLKLNFKVPVVVAGAFSLKDRDKEKLRGLVRSATVTQASFGYDQRSDKYFEKPEETVGKSVYDLDGNEVEKWFYLNGKLFIRHIYTYDENGFKTRHVEEYASGTRKEYEVTLAESMSEKLNEKMFSGSSETPISKSAYDREGNEIELTIKLTTGVQRWVFTYGRNGFVTEEKIYQNDKLESINRSSYETDDHGNWIKRYETGYDTKYPELGFSPNSMTYREIIYFGQQ